MMALDIPLVTLWYIYLETLVFSYLHFFWCRIHLPNAEVNFLFINNFFSCNRSSRSALFWRLFNKVTLFYSF